MTGQNPSAQTEIRAAGISAARREFARQVLSWASLAAGLVGAVWIWHRHTAVRPEAPPAVSVDRRGNGILFSSQVVNGFGGTGGQVNLNEVIPQRLSIYVANLTTRVSDYVISVRQVIGPGQQQSFYEPKRHEPVPERMRGIQISLQVMSANPAALQRVADFAVHLTAVDNTGQHIMHPGKPDISRIIAFPNGLARIVWLPAPAPEARYLKVVQGEIEIAARPVRHVLHQERNHTNGPAYVEATVDEKAPPAVDGSVHRVPFRIENVPLPVNQLLYGGAAATYDTPAAVRNGPQTAALSEQGLRLVTGTEVDVWHRRMPPYTPEPSPIHQPTHMVFAPDLPNRFLVPLPDLGGRSRALECSVNPHVGPDGEIAVQLTARRADRSEKPLTTSFRMWDNEPITVFVPETSGGGDRFAARPIVLWLHLYLQMPPPDLNHIAEQLSPFPALLGERGGELVGQVRVASQPFPHGHMRLQMSRLDLAPSTQHPVTRLVPLDRYGMWRLANCAPGRYAIRVLQIEPNRSPLTLASPWQDYLRRHYGIGEEAWKNAAQDNVVIRPGAQVVLPPTDIVDRRQSAGSASAALPLPSPTP